MMNDIMNFVIEDNTNPIITVIGIGGAGSNAVSYMYESGVSDINYIICNTDLKALNSSTVPTKIQLGIKCSEGDGAGNNALNGRNAAIESLDDVLEHISDDTKMVFLTAGMGGGTGTGAAPVLAQALKKRGLLTVGIVSIPFHFEGRKRINQAVKGILKLNEYIDSLIIVDNERIFDLYPDLPFTEAYSKVDDVVTNAAKGVSELINLPGYVNVDFQDVRTVLTGSGVALMGTASSSGEERALNSIKLALESPLLENSNIKGAKNILLNIISGSGDDEIRMDEVSEITDYVLSRVGEGAQVLWGCGYDNKLEDRISVTIVATDFVAKDIEQIMSLPDIDFKSIRQQVKEEEIKANSQNKIDNIDKDSEEISSDINNCLVSKEKEEIKELIEPIDIVDECSETNNIVDINNVSVEPKKVFVLDEVKDSSLPKIEIDEKKLKVQEDKQVDSTVSSKEDNQKAVPSISMLQAVMKTNMSESEIKTIESSPAYERHKRLVE